MDLKRGISKPFPFSGFKKAWSFQLLTHLDIIINILATVRNVEILALNSVQIFLAHGCKLQKNGNPEGVALC